MPITELYDSNFAAGESEKTTLIEFYASWCPYCRAVRHTLERFSDARSDINVATVNVDENPALSKQFGIMSVPTFIVIRDGRVVGRTAGAVSRGTLEEMVSAKEAEVY